MKLKDIFLSKDRLRVDLEKTNFSNNLKQVLPQATEGSTKEYLLDRNSSETYNAFMKSKTMLDKNSVLFSEDPKTFYNKTDENITEFVTKNEYILKDQQKKLLQDLHEEKISRYLELQQGVLEKEHIKAKDLAIKKFSLDKQGLLKYASLDPNMLESSYKEFSKLLKDSNYGKRYMSKSEEQYETNTFFKEYKQEAKWNDIDKSNVVDGFTKVFSLNPADDNDIIYNRFMNKIYKLEENENIQQQGNKDVLNKIQQSLTNTMDNAILNNDTDTYEKSLVKLNTLNNDYGVIDKYKSNLAYALHGERLRKGDANNFKLNNIQTRLNTGMLTTDEAEDLFNNREITLAELNKLKSEITGNGDPIQKLFNTQKRNLTTKLADKIFTGTETLHEMQDLAINNSDEYVQKSKLFDVYNSELTRIKDELASGVQYSPKELVDRLAKVETKIDSELNLMQSNANNLKYEDLSLSDLIDGIDDLENCTGIFYGKPLSYIEYYIDKFNTDVE